MTLHRDAVGTTTEPGEQTWTSTDAMLYALAVGAGPDDLAFTTENTSGVAQRALPTMAVTLNRVGPGRNEVLGDFDRSKLVHGEQHLALHRPVPTEGRARSVAQITGIWDKGSGAVVVTETTTVDAATGAPLWTNTSSVFIRGEGGWGGERGPSAPAPTPEGLPEWSVRYRTRPDQALLYRLTGDRNPLHSDPQFAAAGGFGRPILHGLCTFGFAGRAVLNACCGDDPSRLRAIGGRFAAPVLPGDELTVDIWRDEEGAARFEVRRTDSTVVIGSGHAAFTEELTTK